MNKLTRRRVLRLVPGAGVTAGALVLRSESPVTSETPWVCARALARQLSRTLALCEDGSHVAVIHADGYKIPPRFENADHFAREALADDFARRFHAMVTEGDEDERAAFHFQELQHALQERSPDAQWRVHQNPDAFLIVRDRVREV